jgi:hypothetical protein
MLILDLFEELEGPPEPTLIDALRDFLPLAVKHLELKKLPKIKLLGDVETEHMPSFGKFSNDDRTVHLGIKNRHPNDVLRTLAHELTHYAQGEYDELDADSGATGSPEEDQANAEAGVIMREFNKQFPQYMALKPIVFESSDYERDMQSDPSSPIPFPPGTTLVNVSDVYDWYKLGMAVPALDRADPRIFNKGVPHTVFAFGSEEEEHRMMPLLKRLGFTLHDIDKPEDYEKAIRASDVVEHLEQYVAEKWSKKYKKSINCSNPKGFSQKAHCAGRKKHTNENFADGEIKESKETRQALLDQHFEFPQQGQYGYRTGYQGRGVLEVADGRTGKIINLGEFGTFDGDREPNQKWLRIVFTNPNMDDNAWDELEDMLWSDDQVAENFADGKNPQDKGDSKRHGIPKGATMAQLEKAAKAPGRKGQLARWQINMRRGKKK